MSSHRQNSTQRPGNPRQGNSYQDQKLENLQTLGLLPATAGERPVIKRSQSYLPILVFLVVINIIIIITVVQSETCSG